MGESRGDKVRIWTDVPLHQQPCSTLESANEFAERIALRIEEAKAALTKVKDEYTMYYNH
jgi:hypothetical protein